MICNESAIGNEVTYDNLTNPSDVDTIFRTAMYGKIGCSVFTYNAIWQFFSKYKYLWGTIFICVGTFMAFLGR